MTEKPISTKEQVLTTPSRKILFECLVKGLTIKQAAEEANLSYRYARKWVAESNIQALVLREIAPKTEDLREKRLQEVRARIATLAGREDKTNEYVKLVDLEANLCGWKTQTINLESQSRQHELDERQRQFACELAIARRKLLTGSEVTISDVKPATSEDNEKPDTTDGNADKKSPT